MLTGFNMHLWYANVYLQDQNMMQNRPEHDAKGGPHGIEF